MELSEQGWVVLPFPPADQKLMDSFNNLQKDQYALNSQRYRRFSQYRVFLDNNQWVLEKLPHRPLIQPPSYNSAAGGIYREFAPIECDPSKEMNYIFNKAGLAKDKVWHLDINQYRVYTQPGKQGVCVPEGAHQDGHQFVKILVFKRNNISGAELSLLPLDSNNPFLVTTIQENEVIILDDTKMRHNATNISAISDTGGYRDYFGTSMNLWENRRYGSEFEQRMLVAK